MESIILTNINWSHFLTGGLGFIALYFALQFLKRILRLTSTWGDMWLMFQRWADYLLLVYEMVAVTGMTGIFVMINPFYHGILVVILILIANAHMKNYFSGRVLQLKNQILADTNIQIGEAEGLVYSLNRLGLQLQTDKGLHYIPYGKVLSNGYTLLAGKHIGGYYELNIRSNTKDKNANHEFRLLDVLTMAPYVDWHHKPEILIDDNDPQHFVAKVLVREEAHLHDLISLIREWGYDCQLAH